MSASTGQSSGVSRWGGEIGVASRKKTAFVNLVGWHSLLLLGVVRSCGHANSVESRTWQFRFIDSNESPTAGQED